MAMSDERTKRDLILSPGTYAYMRDTASGAIKTASGPTVINPTAQEEPVIYDSESASFKRVSLDEVSKKAVIAPEGYYVILRNPALSENNAHPTSGKTQGSIELDVGRKIIIPGPAMFPLWPGQAASVVRGHQIKFNQYLVARVYNEDQATKNWTSAVIKPAKIEKSPDDATPADQTIADAAPVAAPLNLTVGTLLIIRGDKVSFYIPPTGITVQHGDNGEYVQDALTLERLEYAILVGQDGNKRYEKGPQVVFPTPSERFVEAKDDRGQPTKKFRAVELNNLQGLHIKVIADYTEGGISHKAGDELFITGKDTAIYYPREEHSAIKYDGVAKHFATAIPAGEARYVMNRLTGDIKTVRGPAMLLPDPRTEVIVRRTLTETQASLWYPGNREVAEYNQHLRTILSSVPTTRQGAISEGDYERNTRGGGDRGVLRSAVVSAAKGGVVSAEKSSGQLMGVASAQMESSRVSGQQSLVGDEFSRQSTYNQPRTIDLNTKFQGAPKVEIHTGYAVQVIATGGDRFVAKGPRTVLLNYDQKLEIIHLSQGKPKTTDKLLPTVYLRVDNNKVSDIIEADTNDHVKIKLHMSYNINFEGDDTKWFSIENYVQFACHHIRSVLQGAILKIKFEAFYTNSRDIIRDTILQKSADGKRSGMTFPENGMRVGEVDITKVEILDTRIRDFIESSQFETVKSNIEIASEARKLSTVIEIEKLTQQAMAVKAQTSQISDKISIENLASKLTVSLAQINNKLKEIEQTKLRIVAEEEISDISTKAQIDRKLLDAKATRDIMADRQKVELELLMAETKATIDQFSAAAPGFSAALTALGDKDTLVKVAQAWSIQRVIGGDNIVDSLRRIFINTPLQGIMEKISTMATNGSSLLPVGIDSPSPSS